VVVATNSEVAVIAVGSREAVEGTRVVLRGSSNREGVAGTEGINRVAINNVEDIKVRESKGDSNHQLIGTR
jgi:hypothetical protein